MHSRTVLLVTSIEELAAVVALSGLDEDEVAAVLVVPMDHRAAGELTVRWAQPDLRVGELDRNIAPVPVPMAAPVNRNFGNSITNSRAMTEPSEPNAMETTDILSLTEEIYNSLKLRLKIEKERMGS